MQPTRVLRILTLVLLASTALPQTATPRPVYKSKAIVAVLPGNPFDSRIYSLQRFLQRDQPSTRGRLILKWIPDADIALSVQDANSSDAVAIAKQAMDALIGEVEQRGASDPSYGSARLRTPAHATPTGAEGTVSVDGLSWSQAQRQQTRRQIAELQAAILDSENLRAVVKQGILPDQNTSAEEIQQIVREVRSSISFRSLNDSRFEVTLLSSDFMLLAHLLDYLPRRDVDLAGRVPLPDLDFVPRDMRRDWYIFNCCQSSRVGAGSPDASILWTIGKVSVTAEAPPQPVVKTSLSPEERRENFEILWAALDKTYGHFVLKGIDWAEVHERYRSRLAGISGFDDYLKFLRDLVLEMKDSHAYLGSSYRASEVVSGPGLKLEMFSGKPFVVGADPKLATDIPPGSEILEVDGQPAAEVARRVGHAYLGGRSSERAARRASMRILLGGPKGSSVTVKFRAPDGQVGAETMPRRLSPIYYPALPSPLKLTRQQFVHYGKDNSGIGYIQIASFNGSEIIADEFDRALEALRDTPGLIVDVRGNGGGRDMPQRRILGRFLEQRVMTTVARRKNGPGHTDLWRYPEYLGPAGPWQYTGPVALLIDNDTGSGADLFTARFRRTGRAVLIGTKTHGNLPSALGFIELPCGVWVKASCGYMSDYRDRSIEVNGSDPDIGVETTIADYLAGKDPVFDTAVSVLTGPNPLARRVVTAAQQLDEIVTEASFQVDRKEFAQAKAALEGVLAKAPEHPQANRYLGIALTELREYDQAERHLRKAVELRPNDFEARLALGELYLKRANWAPALHVADELLAADRNSLQATGLRVRALIGSGRRDEGLHVLQSFIVENSGFDAVRALGKAWLKVGERP